MIVVHICVGGGFVGYLVPVWSMRRGRGEIFRRVELNESERMIMRVTFLSVWRSRSPLEIEMLLCFVRMDWIVRYKALLLVVCHCALCRCNRIIVK